MANLLVERIPLNDIDKIVLYDNTHTKKSIWRLKSELNPDLIINGGIYNMRTFEMYCNVKIDGRVAANPHYNEYGMRWNRNDIAMDLIPDNAGGYQNYLGMKSLRFRGQNHEPNDYDSGLGGKRGRSAIAIAPNGDLVLLCSKDGTSSAMYPSALRNYLVNMYNCPDILMLDGGGSSQCDFRGNRIRERYDRTVANLILVYLKKKPIEYPAPKEDADIQVNSEIGTTTTNLNYRSGPGTNYQRLGTLSRGTKITIIGKNNSNTWYKFKDGWVSAKYVAMASNQVSKCPYPVPTRAVHRGNRGNDVKWLQWNLVNQYGYNISIDGSFGGATDRALRDFQRKHNLSVDGYAGPATRNCILN